MKLSFKTKLIIFSVSVVILPSIILIFFFMLSFNNFKSSFDDITNFSLEQNKTSIKESTKEYLNNLIKEETDLIYLQIKSAIDNISILGKSTQKLIDNYDDLSLLTDVYNQKLFHNNIIEYEEALTNPATEEVNVLAPPQIAGDKRSRTYLQITSFLNLIMGPVFEANSNNTFVYFVGDEANPVTRAYPNINLAEVLGEGINLLFWKDYFQPNVDPWKKFYTDETLRNKVMKNIGTPITVNPPYEDAAGQGKMITIFYPLWNYKDNKFAGAVGADITLNNIIKNILSIKVAETGYAFLINGNSEIIAMPEKGFKNLKIDYKEQQIGSLSYYSGSLSSSKDSGIQSIYNTILDSENGFFNIELDNKEKNILVFSSLPSINDNQYQEDKWKVIIIVPEKEVLSSLYETHEAITNKSEKLTVESLQSSFLSLIFLISIVVIVIIITVLISGKITKNIKQLANAAKEISKKNYEIKTNLKSNDEIGELGKVFNSMTEEIKDYTENLEEKVRVRTEELSVANKELTSAFDEIKVLNEKLKDENIHLSAELDVARRLQLMVLPSKKETENIKDLDISCFMKPAQEVGGDYYDFLEKDDGSLLIGVGDVTGHGLASGVIMLMTQTAVRTLSQTGIMDMKNFINTLNYVLYKNIERIREDKNMTLSLINYKDEEYTVVGQHESIIICRNDGKIEIKDTMDLGLFLGLEPDISNFVNIATIKLSVGDIMVLFTDGITEAINENKEEFGIERLCQIIKDNHSLTVDEIRSKILFQVYSFIGNAEIHDDITVIVIKQKY